MRRLSITSVLALVAGLIVVLGPAPAQARPADKNCSDFGSQAAAQNWLNSHPGDPDGLDRDGDGVACDSNPCPCYYGGGGGGGSSTPAKPKKPKKRTIVEHARVVRVIDGDTVKVRIGKKRRTVRILGIDTPERGQCGFDQATTSAKRKMPVGAKVKLTSDTTQSEKDRYGRILRYVQRGKADISRVQLKRGWARVLVVGKPFKRVKAYRAVQRKAINRGRGMWGMC